MNSGQCSDFGAAQTTLVCNDLKWCIDLEQNKHLECTDVEAGQ